MKKRIIFRKWMGSLAIGLEFEPRDTWLGIYWDSKIVEDGFRETSLFICVIPILPIRIIICTKGTNRWRLGKG